MKITIARLRSNVKYNGPLETVLDSFFENYVKWMKINWQHEYRTYNVSFDTSRPKRTPETIDWADVIVIPSDSEFRYHGELQMNPKDLAKSESHMETIRPFFEGKDVIMFRSDRGDTEELYRSFLPGIRNFTTIDEVDFSGNIHGMKYHFIQTLKNPLADMFDEGKSIDWAYWGRMKHGNDREKTIRKIYRSELSTVMIGGFPSGVKRQAAWIKDWKKLYPNLSWDWGMFGENLTIEGLDEFKVRVGDIYRIGEALVQVSQPREPCYKLGIRFGTQKILKEFIAHNHPGTYVKILEEGTVKTGDGVVLIERSSNSLTVQQFFELMFLKEKPQELLSLFMTNESVPQYKKDRFKKYLS